MKTRRTILILWLALLTPLLAQAQDTLLAPILSFSHRINISSPTSISQDRNGNIYLLDERQNLLRLNPAGQPVDTYSPPARGRISSIHAWNPMKIMLFYEGSQEITLLDRFLRPISTTGLLNLQYEGTAKVAAPAGDLGYWLFDETRLSLGKLDPSTRQLSVETPLNLLLSQEQFDVRQLREYQNLVYLLDYNSGILIFDNLGNYKKRLPIDGLQHIGFRNNELYYVKEGKLYFLDLYSTKERVLELPQEQAYTSALAGDKQLFLFTKNAVDVYFLE
ncbi:hypothetical protein [Pontibacter chinhatensis]|uniref:DUF5050 domain-containing protein n=1 Tax=Pontibacter chinhatensis TaxID=1436961 RepID=A0A1I2VIB9_9BACT|nr:hypothetical protein [Pontibacter chinhatensis]SFG87957.1 hypothetical protein SAMN05421739_104171 [Pontibacter chinhatensis]